MANLDNVVNGTRCTQFINSVSDALLGKILNLIPASNRRHILVSYFQADRKQPPSKHRECVISNFMTIVQHCTRAQHQRQESSLQSPLSLQTNSPLFTQLSHQLLAHILAFTTMKDRLVHCERVSRHFYYAAQRYSAKAHLVVNKRFVRHALCNRDGIDESNFYGAQTLDIEFVYCNPSCNYKGQQEADLEAKFYRILNRIVRHSPQLSVLRYNLTENAFRSYLGLPKQNRKKYEQQYDGSLIDFAWNLRHSLRRSTALRSLVWNERPYCNVLNLAGGLKILEPRHQWMLQAGDIHRFRQVFANLESLAIPNHLILSSFSSVCLAWCHPTHLQRLRHLHVNLDAIHTDVVDEDRLSDDDVQCVQTRHPLAMLHRFQRLQSLHLKLPIFIDCESFYQPMMTAMEDDTGGHTLQNISLHFDIRSKVVSLSTVNLIDDICGYVAQFAVHIKQFACTVSNHGKRDYNLSAAFMHKLDMQSIQSLHVASNALHIENLLYTQFMKVKVFSRLRQLSLTLGVFKRNCHFWEYLPILSMKRLRFLQLLQLRFGGAENRTFEQKYILQFLQHIHSQKIKYCASLKRIELVHDSDKLRFNVKTAETMAVMSQKLCRLLVAITTKHKRIRCIQLEPTFIGLEELRYLHFWYHDEFGSIQVEQMRKMQKSHLVKVRIDKKRFKPAPINDEGSDVI